MRKAIVVVGLLAVVALVVGANVDGTAKPISQIPITQAFRMDVGKIGNINRQGYWKPYIATLPKNAGIAITEINTPHTTGAAAKLVVKVNGIQVLSTAMGYINEFVPPILVPPGGTLEIGKWHSNPGETMDIGIAGYYLTLADLGI